MRWRARIIISSNEKRGERERKKGDVEWPEPLKEPWNGLGSQVVKEKKETRERERERNKEEKKKGNKKKEPREGESYTCSSARFKRAVSDPTTRRQRKREGGRDNFRHCHGRNKVSITLSVASF